MLWVKRWEAVSSISRSSSVLRAARTITARGCSIIRCTARRGSGRVGPVLGSEGVELADVAIVFDEPADLLAADEALGDLRRSYAGSTPPAAGSSQGRTLHGSFVCLEGAWRERCLEDQHRRANQRPELGDEHPQALFEPLVANERVVQQNVTSHAAKSTRVPPNTSRPSRLGHAERAKAKPVSRSVTLMPRLSHTWA